MQYAAQAIATPSPLAIIRLSPAPAWSRMTMPASSPALARPAAAPATP